MTLIDSEQDNQTTFCKVSLLRRETVSKTHRETDIKTHRQPSLIKPEKGISRSSEGPRPFIMNASPLFSMLILIASFS